MRIYFQTAHHEIRNQSFIEMHAYVRSQAPERVSFVLTYGAHERLDAVVVVQVFLGSGRALAYRTAHRTLPAVGRGRTLVMKRVSIDDHLQMAVAIINRPCSWSSSHGHCPSVTLTLHFGHLTAAVP